MAGRPELEWTDDDADAYRLAYDLLTELIAAIDARIDTAHNPSESLFRERAFFVEKRRTLSVVDREETRNVIDTYTSRLNEFRAGES